MNLEKQIVDVLTKSGDFVSLEYIARQIDASLFDALTSLYELLNKNKVVKKLHTYNNNSCYMDVWKIK